MLRTVPGVSSIPAAALIAEVGYIHRFSNAHKLVAYGKDVYAGIDATITQFGECTAAFYRISKRGSPELRMPPWFAAASAQRPNLDSDIPYEAEK